MIRAYDRFLQENGAVMDGYNVVGAAVMFVLAIGSYVLLQLVAKSLQLKKKKKWLERNSSGSFDIDP